MLVMADPTDIPVVDELSLILQAPVQPAVGTPSAIQEALKRSQGTQRVLEQASESFKIQLLRDDDNGDEVLSIDKIQADQSPIIKLVDSDGVRRAQPARLRHPHRDPRRRGGDQVPHRRCAPAGHEADRQGAPLHDHQPHQGHVGAGHRGEAGAAGRALPGEDRRPLDRLPRLDHAVDPRRGRGHPHPRQGEPVQAVRLAAARRAGLRREGAPALPPLHPRALRHGAGDRPDRLRQDHDALRRPLRDQDGRGQDHHHRGPGRVPAQGRSPRSR